MNVDAGPFGDLRPLVRSLAANRILVAAARPGTLDSDRLLSCLTAEESARAAAFRFDADRHRFLTGRALARSVLCEVLGRRPVDLSLIADRYGKPRIADGPGLDFNVSHSGDLVLLAVARDGNVGIDVEQWRPGLDLIQLARRSFSEPEQRQLNPNEPGLLAERFYRFWTCKEAWLKCSGRGLSLAPESFTVSPTDQPGWHKVVGSEAASAALIAELPVAAGYSCAVAADRAGWSAAMFTIGAQGDAIIRD